MQNIIKNHICRFNDEPQVCECFVEGVKQLLQALIEGEEKELAIVTKNNNGTMYEEGYIFAQKDIVEYLKGQIELLQ